MLINIIKSSLSIDRHVEHERVELTEWTKVLGWILSTTEKSKRRKKV
jgi:hypothetical protein